MWREMKGLPISHQVGVHGAPIRRSRRYRNMTPKSQRRKDYGAHLHRTCTCLPSRPLQTENAHRITCESQGACGACASYWGWPSFVDSRDVRRNPDGVCSWVARKAPYRVGADARSKLLGISDRIAASSRMNTSARYTRPCALDV
jgi:hypothetical protein